MLQLFPIIVDGLPGRAVLKGAIQAISELFVETGRIEVGSSRAGVTTAPCPRFPLCPFHQLPPQPLASVGLVHPQDCDLQPGRNMMRPPNEAPDHRSLTVEHVEVYRRGRILRIIPPDSPPGVGMVKLAQPVRDKPFAGCTHARLEYIHRLILAVWHQSP